MTIWRQPLHKARGFAIGMILAAVAIVVALGIAMSVSMRAGNATSETNSQRLLAATLMNQAAILKSALVVTQARTSDVLNYEHLDTGANNFSDVGIYHPVDGAADAQTPPAGSVTGSSTGWHWGGYYWSSALLLPGLPSYFYVISLSYLQPGVCAQIDQQLTGSTSIPAVTTALNLQSLSSWTDLTGSNYSALNGYYEICFVDSTGNYQYYKTIQDDST